MDDYHVERWRAQEQITEILAELERATGRQIDDLRFSDTEVTSIGDSTRRIVRMAEISFAPSVKVVWGTRFGERQL